MDYYDVVIIGCGPGGGQCARDLAKNNKKVLIVEKARDFGVNNFSSGGVPLSVIDEFSIPESVIGSYWNQLTVHSSYKKQEWKQETPFGAILDFQKLREFLSDDAVQHGGSLRLDTVYIDHWEQSESLIVRLFHHESAQDYTVRTRILVDATGTERKVLAKDHYDKDKALIATGVEYLIQVPETVYESYANTMSLFLGHRWMPQGYGWVFPMGQHQLKVGVVRYFAHDSYVPHNKSYKHYQDHLIKNVLGTKDPQILDKHGKTIYYTYKRDDVHFKDSVIAIGDAISTINPLACEGIRQALTCGKIASGHILKKLTNSHYSFSAYLKEIGKLCGFKWTCSEWIMKKVYRQKNDKNYDLILDTFHEFTGKEMMDFAFGYKFSKIIKFCSGYYSKKFKSLFT